MQSANTKECAELLIFIAGVIKEKKDYLTELDSAIGDGDLGVSMTLGFNAVIEALGEPCATYGELLQKCGIAFSNYAPSTIGVLFATGFLRASSAVQGKTEVRNSDIVHMLEAATQGIRERGKAVLGDKTVLDALVPAVESAQNQGDQSNDICKLMKKAAEAAELGAESTRELKAVQGRSRWLQARSIGHLDPGAIAVAMVLRASSDWFDYVPK